MASHLFHFDTDASVCVSQDGCHASSNETRNVWSGVKSRSGILRGSYHFEVELEIACLLRIGWAAGNSKGAIGMDARSFGFGGSAMKCHKGRFNKYGEFFKDRVGVVVGCFIDRRSRLRQTISYSLNGCALGVAFHLPAELVDVPLFPSLFGCSTWRAEFRWDRLVFPEDEYQPVAAAACPVQATAQHVFTHEPWIGVAVMSGEHADVLPGCRVELTVYFCSRFVCRKCAVVGVDVLGCYLANEEDGVTQYVEWSTLNGSSYHMVLLQQSEEASPKPISCPTGGSGDKCSPVAISQKSLMNVQPKEMERCFSNTCCDGDMIMTGVHSELSLLVSKQVRHEAEQLLSQANTDPNLHSTPVSLTRSEVLREFENDQSEGSTASGPVSDVGDAPLVSELGADALQGLTAFNPKGSGACALAAIPTIEQIVGAGNSVLAQLALFEGSLRVRSWPQGLRTAGLEFEPCPAGVLVKHIDEWPGQPDLQCGDVIVAIGELMLVGLSDEEVGLRFGDAYADGVSILFGHRIDVDHLPIEHVCSEVGRRLSAQEGNQAIAIHHQEVDTGDQAMVTPHTELMRAGKLRVTSVGAGLEVEPSELGFKVRCIDPWPGQPDLRVDDVIMVIGAEPLVGLHADELETRFRKGFSDGAPILIGCHNALEGFVNEGSK